ncbi:MAG: hypothetical protein CTY38_00925 [Methylotenera sp.]|uniref:hypothetical protein n=1 Tax=Methylotenera sp. TaxID=2051956 RepID=UPI000D3F211C|nr:hypothetical protein [Methylotenera sp.]PPC84641.1 MAG: hypothetical protein CTY38_00925 [Methylotenera sp.]
MSQHYESPEKAEMRTEFESVAKDQVSSLQRDSNGHYYASDADTAWWAWQHQDRKFQSKHNTSPKPG